MQCVDIRRKIQKGKIIDFPCGQCEPCIINYKTEWVNRSYVETRYCKTALFLTMTVSDKNLEFKDYLNTETGELTRAETITKERVQTFHKLIRYYDNQHHKQFPLSWTQKTNPIKYLSLGEYGSKTHRQHYHDLIWNLHPLTIKNINEYWPHGELYIGKIESGSISYVVNHQTMNHKEGMLPEQRPFSLKSNNIGIQYIDIHKASHLEGREWFLNEYKNKTAIPRHYRNKIWDNKITNKDKLLKSFMEIEDFEEFNKLHNFKYYNNENAKQRRRLEAIEREAEHVKKYGENMLTTQAKRIESAKRRKTFFEASKRRF